MKFLTHKNKGYTLLFAVLISALVLGVGVSILNIARKELLLNEGARESQYAFYAADSGYECAVYWDSKNSFATSTYATTAPIQCGTLAGAVIATSTVTGAAPTVPGSNAYTFSFALPLQGTQCALVTVTKDYKYITSISTYAVTTAIQSNGYNIGWNAAGNSGLGDCSKSNPIKVERALLITY